MTPLRLYAVLDHDEAALRSGDCALEKDEITFGIDFYHGEILHGYPFVAQVAGHLLVLEYAGRSGARAHGTYAPVIARTVGLGTDVVVPSLDRAGKSLTLGSTGDVHLFARGEYAALDLVAYAVRRAVRQAEFPELCLLYTSPSPRD